MSADSEQTRLDELVRQSQQARERLKQDVETLAYIVSPENLKAEALHVARQAATDTKDMVVRWGAETKAFTRRYPLPLTFALGLGGFLYAGITRRKRALLWTAVACGAGAVVLGVRTRKRLALPTSATPRLLAG